MSAAAAGASTSTTSVHTIVSLTAAGVLFLIRPSASGLQNGQDGVQNLLSSEPHGIVGRQARLALDRLDRRAGLIFTEVARVERDRRHPRGARRKRRAL